MNRRGTIIAGLALLTGAWGWWKMPVAQASVQRQILVPNVSKKVEPSESLRAERLARQERLRELQLDRASLRSFNECFRRVSREQLIADGFLLADSPVKGTRLLGAEHRTAAGNALLQKAKDVLYALLFGDAGSHTRFDRVERELLTLTLPRNKVNSLAFMQAATELAAAGTWQDPESVSNDERAENVIIEVEYGEIREEWIGDGIVTALRLINSLEVNEQVLYARMINVEQSTLSDAASPATEN